MAVTAPPEREPIKVEAKQDKSRQADEGPSPLGSGAASFGSFGKDLGCRDCYHDWRAACYCS
jgi:hypothetical protein